MFIQLIWHLLIWKFCNAMIVFHCSCVNSLWHLLSSNVRLFKSILFGRQEMSMWVCFPLFSVYPPHPWLPQPPCPYLTCLMRPLPLSPDRRAHYLPMNWDLPLPTCQKYCHNFHNSCGWFVFWICSQDLWFSTQ